MTSLKRAALLLALVGCASSSKVSDDASEGDASESDASRSTSTDAAAEDAASRADRELPPPWLAPRWKLPNQIGQRVTYREALGELEDACTRAAPATRFGNGECICVDDRTAIVTFEEDGTQQVGCTMRSEVPVTFEDVEDPLVFQTRADALGSLRVRIGKGTATEREEIARRTAESFEARSATDRTAGQARSIGLRRSDDYVSTLFVGAPPPNDLSISVEAAFDGLHFLSGSLAGATEHPGDYLLDVGIVEPEPEHVASALGVLGTAHAPPPFEHPDTRVRAEDLRSARALREAVVTLLPNAFASTSQTLTFDTLMGSGCVLGICRVFTDRMPVRLDGHDAPRFFATIERAYDTARIGREIVWLDELGKLRGFVVMGPNAGAGLVVLLDQSGSGTEMITRVYDREWNALGEVTLTVHGVPRYDDVASRAHFVDAVAPPARSVLAVCDVHFQPILDAGSATGAELFEGVLFGRPARFSENGSLLSGSLFGWTPNPDGNAYDFLSGIDSSYWAFPVVGTYSDSERSSRYRESHGVPVALVARRAHALAASNVPGASAHSLFVLPVARDRCFDLDAWREAREWRPANDETRPPLVGVANLSFAYPTASLAGRGDCPSSQTHAFESTETSVLWVAAAGNHRNESVKHSICPLRAMRVPHGGGTRTRSNGLIVSSLDSNGAVSFVSNYGADFSDIAAEGTTTPGGSSATSFASPRVAAAAVLLAQMFPGSSPRALRSYLLFGARPRAHLRGVVLAGGELDVARAVRFASCWQATIVPQLATRAPVVNDYAVCVDASAAAGPVPTIPSQDAIDRATTLLSAGESL